MSNVFSFAAHEDGAGILNIMESDVAKGEIRLLYTRRPNPYDSFIKESEKSVVGVFKCDEKIVGTIAGIPRESYVEGTKRNVCYVTNMKRLHDLDSRINWIEAFNKMYDPLDSSVYFCSVVKENTDVLKMLRKERPKLPFAVDMDGYRTYIISPTAPVKNPCKELRLRRATKDDEAEVLSFLGTWGGKKSLFPVITKLDGESAPKITDFYILHRDGKIKALGALWDRTDCKQYVVEEYSGKIAFLRAFNPIISKLGYVTIPPEGTEIKFTFLSMFLAEDYNCDYYRTFLHHIRSEVRKTHDMLVLGTSDHNEKRAVLDEIRALKFDTQLCEVVMSNFRGAERVKFDYTNLEVECALL